MDGKLCILLCLAMDWRPEDGPFSHLDQHADLPYSFFSSTYRAFAATFEAMEAPFFWRETALQLPGQQFLREYIMPEEFVAKEDLHQGKKKSIDMVDEDDNTVCTSNLPPPPV